MATDYSKADLKGKSFRNTDLAHVRFSGSDLRGVDFGGADLSGADFSRARTGITPVKTLWIFLVALVISAFSGYIAMLAGHTLHIMLISQEGNIRTAGIACTAIIILFIVYSIWKGVTTAAKNLVLPVIALALIIGVIFAVSGAGTGKGALNIILVLFLVVLMFVVGTVARASAGALSNVLFVVVALSGAFFGRTVGGGIGSVVLAIATVVISKRALKGAPGFASLRKIARFLPRKFGTSFRNAKLTDADFTAAKMRNTDFSNAEISSVDWENSKKFNCIIE